MEKILEILKRINVPNYDNGVCFTRCDRLVAIEELLRDTPYSCVNTKGLFRLYAKTSVDDLPKKLIVISSHIDCADTLTNFFTEESDGGMLRGTFDNAAGNAAVLSLMLADTLPDNVVVAFTGDEENESRGARALVRYLRALGHLFSVIVTDVTDMGWNEGCDFTVENDFWTETWEQKILNTVFSINRPWRFVPENPNIVPKNLPKDLIIPIEAEPDESWEYDENDVNCFSLCIPVFGEMHTNQGVLMRLSSLRVYAECLYRLATIQ